MLQRSKKQKKEYNFSDIVNTKRRELKVVIRNSSPYSKNKTWCCDVSENTLWLLEEEGSDYFYVEVLL